MQIRAIRSVKSSVLRRIAGGALAVTSAVLLVSGEAEALCADEAVAGTSSGDLTGVLALIAAPLAVAAFFGLTRMARTSEPASPDPARPAAAH